MNHQGQRLTKIAGKLWRYDPVLHSYLREGVELRKDAGKWTRSDQPGKEYSTRSAAAGCIDETNIHYRVGAAHSTIHSLARALAIAIERHPDLKGLGVGNLELASEWMDRECAIKGRKPACAACEHLDSAGNCVAECTFEEEAA